MSKGAKFKPSIDDYKIPWNSTDFLSKYLFLLSTIFFVATSFIFQDLLFEIFFLVSFCILIFSLAAYYKNDKFIQVLSANAGSESKKLIEQNLTASGWHIYRSNRQYLIAYKSSWWLAGSRITALLHKESVYINVKNLNGFRGYIPFSFGRNKRIANEVIGIINTGDQHV